MGGVPLVALGVKGPLDLQQQARAVQGQGIQNQLGQQGIQENALKIQQEQESLAAQKLITQTIGQNGGDLEKSLPQLAGKVPYPIFAGLQKAHVEAQTAAAKLTADQNANDAVSYDKLAGLVTGAQQLSPEQYGLNWPSIAKQAVAIRPDLANQLDPTKPIPQASLGGIKVGFQTQGQISAQTAAKQKADLEASQAKEAEAKAREADANAAAAGGLRPDQIDQYNQGLAARYQVMNPGKQVPPAFTLPPNATPKDFDRVDKLLEGTERAAGTQAQRGEANAMRQATLQIAQAAQQDRLDQHGIQPVSGTDPKTGRDVLVPESDAQKMGLTNVMKADADLVNKSHAARTWLKLADKQGDTPANMGIMQMIDKLDKDGKLGVIASRWNDFMAGKVGAGDPDFAAFRAKMGLGATKLMQAHVGSRGGAFMLEHFEDLANAGKMDASTLRSAMKSEVNYMQDVAMEPGQGAASPASKAIPSASAGTDFFSQFGGKAKQ